MYIFQPTVGSRAKPAIDPVHYEATTRGPDALKAEAVAQFTVSEAGLPNYFRRPPDYIRIAATITAVVVGAAGIALMWNHVYTFVSSRYIWASLMIVRLYCAHAALHYPDDIRSDVDADPTHAV